MYKSKTKQRQRQVKGNIYLKNQAKLHKTTCNVPRIYSKMVSQLCVITPVSFKPSIFKAKNPFLKRSH